jgi:hypothetical protein
MATATNELYRAAAKIEFASAEQVNAALERVLEKHSKAFELLAKH